MSSSPHSPHTTDSSPGAEERLAASTSGGHEHLIAWILIAIGALIQSLGLIQLGSGLASTAVAPPSLVVPITCTLLGSAGLFAGLWLLANHKGHSPMLALLVLAGPIGVVIAATFPDLRKETSPARLDFECPHCGLVTKMDLEYAGKEGKCRRCAKPIRIPSLLSVRDVDPPHNESD